MSEDTQGTGSVSVVERTSSSHPTGVCEPTEEDRTVLITHIARIVRVASMPETTRLAALTFIGWLARRSPSEAPHAIGIDEARESERRMRARAKSG